MIDLNVTGDNWNRDQRNGINENWQRIKNGLNNLQGQIKILAGGEEVDELLQRLNDAVESATIAVQESIDANNAATQDAITANNQALQTALNTIDAALTNVGNAIQAAETATNDAVEAKDAALQAAGDAQTTISQMQVIISNFRPRGEWNATTDYFKNNLAGLDGKTYIALQNNINKPVTDTSFWMLFADRGAKGEKGEKGDPGTGIKVLGHFNDVSELPSNPILGDAYTIGTDKELYVYNGNNWQNMGSIKGVEGKSAYEVAVENGFVGTEIEWLETLVGPPGPDGPPGPPADLTEINQKVDGIQNEVTEHLAEGVLSENGVHGIRYFNGELSVKNGENPWEVVETGGSTVLQDYSTGHLDDLKSTGVYYSSNSPVSRGFPQNIPTSESMITVYKLSDTAIYQQVTFVTNYQTSSPRSISRIYDTAWRQWTFLPMAITQDVNGISNFGSTAIAPSTSVLYDLFFGYPQTPSLNSGWKVQSNGSIRYVKLGNIVHINGTISGNASPPPSLMFTLPVDYRPIRGSVYFSAGTPSRSPNTLTKAEILNTGDVILEATSNININSLVHLNVSFYIG